MEQKLTFQQIVEKLNENNISLSEFGYGDFGEGKENFVEGIGPSKEVDSYGGEEQGSEWYSVRYFPEHDVYIRVDAYYSSYEGADFCYSKFVEVFPTQVTTTEYLPKK